MKRFMAARSRGSQIGLSLFLILSLGFSFKAQASPASCSVWIKNLFNQFVKGRLAPTDLSKKASRFSEGLSDTDKLKAQELSDHVTQKITAVPEFLFIRETAQKQGLRVWLFGGTASSFLHYVKWDLAREKGLMPLQKDRFDFDFTNIFRSTQDLDIVVDASPEKAKEFQNLLANKFPHFLGAKANKWEVRTLRSRIGQRGKIGFKEALLNDSDFENQNTDSNSLGMVEISKSKEPVVRDLKHWNEPISQFLIDALNNKISFFRSSKHFSTFRAKVGENPEILSAIRFLVKAFQYDLVISPEDFAQLREIVRDFDPKKVKNKTAAHKINETASKLIIHAVNIEYAINKLDELGLRKKLVTMGNPNEPGSPAWWLNKEPLRSKPVGKGSGKTAGELARELNISQLIVAHETNNFLAYESITRAHSGEPNVLISRKKAAGENAAFGNGFYTKLGREGARETGFTIRFEVDPNAREGSDFKVYGEFEYIVFYNKKALKVIQESLNLSIEDLLRLAETNQEFQVKHSDLALLEKLKRKINATFINEEFDRLLSSSNPRDFDKVIQVLRVCQNSQLSILFSPEVISSVAKNVYNRIFSLSQSSDEVNVLKYIQAMGPIIKTIDSQGLLKTSQFIDFLRNIISSHRTSFSLKKEALFEILLEFENFEKPLSNARSDLSEVELRALNQEMGEWNTSNDPRKRAFLLDLNKRWSEDIKYGQIDQLKVLVALEIFDINHKNVSGYSLLMLASYYKKEAIIEWLLNSPAYDFNSKDNLGVTEVEQLRLLGKEELAQRIERERPEVRARKFQVRERNDDQSPIIDFVRIEPGTFLMGQDRYIFNFEGPLQVLTTITKPFEISSTETTQKQWRSIAESLIGNLGAEYVWLDKDPSAHKGENHPVEMVSHDITQFWIRGLNELSKIDSPRVQKLLEENLPGHKKGDVYRLPTEAEWEFTARLGGLAEGRYSFGDSDADLDNSAVYDKNSGYVKKLGGKPQDIGTKKPVFYNGKPIYDLHGNVYEWTADRYEMNLQGGIDPHGPPDGPWFVSRGGGSSNDALSLLSAHRCVCNNSDRLREHGFRLVRDVLP